MSSKGNRMLGHTIGRTLIAFKAFKAIDGLSSCSYPTEILQHRGVLENI